MTNWNIPSLRPYVRRRPRKNERALRRAAREWQDVSARNRLDYECEWLGMPVIQTPEDMVLMQELIFTVRPDVIIESGIAHGGSLVFYASIMALLGKGRVIGVDIDIRAHNRAVLSHHPLFSRISLIEGDSTAPKTLAALNRLVKPRARVIVCLDSNHYRDHVLAELRLYERFVHRGGYLVVFDTVTSLLARRGACDRSYINNGPAEAVGDFLKENRAFVRDRSFNKLYISTSSDGYLKRVR